ncbi:hypothetical protein DEJ16_03490 [Curtobacterium sp. MCJR17_055]|uniref:hypothetical protein n=1 Tax=unclassified Curtobacterium TaxID=257496 RepID=UPI000D862C51|nr:MULTISPECIES: hypothetical protein [unclassified Curtobacterium]PYY33795.1 hypothetical protein DEI87_11070 [Curtobacterium sp. MCBD17_029]PYY58735.1 hypothetical protein DEJ16_03490 [Curtobacterium sp. MCJR17_055]PYY59724.1 hypothetical protein DEJ26_07415 [Curtobacterium sp. MCPF17_015]
MAEGAVMEVRAVLALLEPVFREMLHADELRSTRFHLTPADDPWGHALQPDDLVETNNAVVWWRIAGERGVSGGLWLDDGPEMMARLVQSALQEFIAESRFGWGQFRGPHDLP